jgi:hypothetical protein
MAISRFNRRAVVFNNKNIYRDHFKARDVKYIRHFNTPDLSYPTPSEIESLQIVHHLWKLGDRLYKLSDFHYGSAELWWLIAWFNKKPTDAHIQLNDIIEIPFPFERIFNMFEG